MSLVSDRGRGVAGWVWLSGSIHTANVITFRPIFTL